METALLSLVLIVTFGITGQWLAWRFRLPSILLLLLLGFVAGPVTGWIRPDELMGRLLLPVVSLSVAVILFEGGLSLRFRDIEETGGVFLRLITVGALVTWAGLFLAAHYMLGLSWPISILLGAVLVVTGPTVIGPLLQHIRLGGRLASLLRWEGIVIDPLGAIFAVLVFQVVRAGELHFPVWETSFEFGQTLLAGTVAGVISGIVLIVLLRRFLIPDFLENAVTLMLVLATFGLANHFQEESGLLAVTVMGMILANQRSVTIHHVAEFKENLSVLLISGLFIVLAARLSWQDVLSTGLPELGFLLTAIFVVRPLAVLIASIGSSLTWAERVFLAFMAPRGIVAAAIASVFSLELLELSDPGVHRLVPLTFLIIVGTVTIYGLASLPLARVLGLIHPNPQGIVFVGAFPWVRKLAAAVQQEGIPVILIDSDRSKVAAAKMEGLPAYFGSALSQSATEELDLSSMRRLVAVTPNDELNTLACQRFAPYFGRSEVYQLPCRPRGPGQRLETVSREQRGRILFDREISFHEITELFGLDPAVRATRLSKEFDFDAFQRMHGRTVLPVFLIRRKREVFVFTSGSPVTPQPGDVIISLASPATPEEEVNRRRRNDKRNKGSEIEAREENSNVDAADDDISDQADT